MAYLGNNLTVQQYSPQIAYFSGNGSTTAFTLPVSVVSAAQIIVVVANVVQNPSSAYTVSGTTLTFTSAPPTGTNNIWVEYTSLQTNTVVPTYGTVGISQFSATGTPSSTTYLRGDNTWATAVPVATSYQASYLVVGGGGGSGGGDVGGGAGGGGFQQGAISLAVGVVYTATIGAGGSAGARGGNGGTGNTSTLAGTTGLYITSLGGGYGGAPNTSAGNGASGGGAGGAAGGGSTATGGYPTSGQGNFGSSSNGSGGLNAAYAGSGGGAGVNANAGNGGNGLQSSITGSATYYGGGGAGGQYGTVSGQGTGGLGGGANGGNGTGGAGTANLGGGASGGGTASGTTTGAAGGSGVIILAVPTSNYTGTTTGSPTITTSGPFTIIKFTSSGSYTA